MTQTNEKRTRDYSNGLVCPECLKEHCKHCHCSYCSQTNEGKLSEDIEPTIREVLAYNSQMSESELDQLEPIIKNLLSLQSTRIHEEILREVIGEDEDIKYPDLGEYEQNWVWGRNDLRAEQRKKLASLLTPKEENK